MAINSKRIRILKEGHLIRGPVVYCVSREQRENDNRALLFAQKKAPKMQIPILVVFNQEKFGI